MEKLALSHPKLHISKGLTKADITIFDFISLTAALNSKIFYAKNANE